LPKIRRLVRQRARRRDEKASKLACAGSRDGTSSTDEDEKAPTRPFPILARVTEEQAGLGPQRAKPARVGRRRLALSAAIFSALTAISRIVGLFREIIARRYFGVEGPINAFTVAFQVPNLVRALVADLAFSGAFVPVFSGMLERGERARAWRVASTLFWLLFLGLGGLTAVFILLAPWLMKPFGYAGEQQELVVGLSRVLFPVVILLGLSGVVVGILNSYEEFAIPALTPILWNLAIIAALVIGVPRADTASAKLYVYAGGVVAGTVIQFLFPFPWLRGLDGRLRVAIDIRDPAVKQVFVLMLPVTLGLGLINFNALVDTFFAARFLDPQLAPSAIDAAFRIYMLPQGMFSVAVATVLFPSLSRLAARGDLVGFRATASLGVRQICFLLVPAAALSAALAEPIVRLLYQRGEFTPDQTRVVADALAAFSLGLTFNGIMLMLNRAFFSLQSPWIPTSVALANLGVNIAADAALYHVGVWGIPLATSIVNVIGACALAAIFRRRVGPLDGRRIADAVWRIAASAAVATGVAYGLWYALDRALGDSLGAQIVSLGGALVAGAASYVLSARLLGIRELDALLGLWRRSGPRRDGASA
jgi:putative peptidoglycan lipid II flippase